MDAMDILRDEWNDRIQDVPHTIGITCAVNPLEMMEDPPIPFDDAFNGNENRHGHTLARSSSLGPITELLSLGTLNELGVNELLKGKTNGDHSFEKNQADVNIKTCTLDNPGNSDNSLVRKTAILTTIRSPPVETSNLPEFNPECRFPNAVSSSKQLNSTVHRLYIANNGEQSIGPHRNVTKVGGLERPDEDEDNIMPGRAGSGSTAFCPCFQALPIYKGVIVQRKFSTPLVDQGTLDEIIDNGGAAATDVVIAGTALECSIDKEDMMLDEEVSNAIFQNDTEEGIQAALALYDWEVCQARIRISDVHIEGDFESSSPYNWIQLFKENGNKLLPPPLVARRPRKARKVRASPLVATKRPLPSGLSPSATPSISSLRR